MDRERRIRGVMMKSAYLPFFKIICILFTDFNIDIHLFKLVTLIPRLRIPSRTLYPLIQD